MEVNFPFFFNQTFSTVLTNATTKNFEISFKKKKIGI